MVTARPAQIPHRSGKLGARCHEGPPPKARAVINYYGATDLEPLLREGKPHRVKWLSGAGDPFEMARRMSRR
jgi:hypothetical protein